MISYIHIPVLIVCFMLLSSMWRFWSCIGRMGFTREIGRRAPTLVQRDILAAVLAAVPFVLATVDWLGITLPRQEEALSPLVAAFGSLACIGGAIFTLQHSGDRFAGHWAGSREGALRTVAALRIIDAAELAYALRVLEENEAHLRQNGGGSSEVAKALAVLKEAQVIEGEVREVRK
jgi:hypothetical protein